jgi:hypothetical protein
MIRDTTGEKGLGFKSVFGIANKIHVQSGLWSFRFEHSQGQDGLGMVTPIWTERPSEALPIGIGTRFTLTYAEQNDRFVKRVEAEFEKATETIIFALRKLKKLEILSERITGRSNLRSFEKSLTTSESGENMSIITRLTGPSNTASSSETKLRIVRRLIRDMPSSDVRRSSTSEVVLGFQVSPNNGAPVVPSRGQHTFAYLPVQRLPQLPVRLMPLFIRRELTFRSSSFRLTLSLPPTANRSLKTNGTAIFATGLQMQSCRQSSLSASLTTHSCTDG